LSRGTDFARNRSSRQTARIADLSAEIAGDPTPAGPPGRAVASFPRGGHRMSESDSQSLQNLMGEWTASLAELLESMTMQRPGVRWQAVTGTDAEGAVGPAADLLWWEQAFQFSPEALVWVGAPRTTWEHAAALMLKAAGLEPDSGKDEGVEA